MLSLSKNLLLERKDEVMKHFLKGAAAVAITMIISVLIHVFFNMRGIDLNRYVNNYAEILLLTSLATLIYHVLTRNEKNKND